MLHYDRIDASGEISVNKTSKPREWDICHYWCFLDKVFKFQPDVCNGCHDVLMMFMNLSDITILNINGADYHCIINGIIKSDVINLMEYRFD